MGTVGDKLRQARGSKSQEAFAEDLGVTQSHLSRLESAEVGMSVEVAQKYARGLGIDPMVLLLGHAMEVANKLAERGDVTPGQAAQKTSRALNLAYEAGVISDAELQSFVRVGQGMVAKARQVAGRPAIKGTGEQYDMLSELAAASAGEGKQAQRAVSAVHV